MDKFIYAFSLYSWNNYPMYKSIVIKESDKTYTIKAVESIDNSSGLLIGYERKIRKELLGKEQLSSYFYLTEEEMRQGRIDYFNRQIEIEKRRIEISNANIKTYENFIKGGK